MILTPTHLTYKGIRLWLETEDGRMADHMAYRVKNNQATLKESTFDDDTQLEITVNGKDDRTEKSAGQESR